MFGIIFLIVDKFHAGVFLGVGEASGVGFLIGYKWVSRRNIIFKFGGGLGRGFNGDDAVGYGKLHIGYRFGEQRKG